MAGLRQWQQECCVVVAGVCKVDMVGHGPGCSCSGIER